MGKNGEREGERMLMNVIDEDDEKERWMERKKGSD